MQKAIRTLTPLLHPSLAKYPKTLTTFPGRLGIWESATMEKVAEFMKGQQNRIAELLKFQRKDEKAFTKALDRLPPDERTLVNYLLALEAAAQREAVSRRPTTVSKVLGPSVFDAIDDSNL